MEISHDRILWLDIDRDIAIFLVIIIHTTATTITAFDQVSILNWIAADLYDSLAFIAVPLFVMISGYLLLDKTEDYKTFFKKRAIKIIIPLIAWTIIYIIAYHYQYGTPVTLDLILSDLLTGNACWHLYFLYLIIGLYMITPLLRILLKNARPPDLWYIIILWIFSVPIYGILSEYMEINSNLVVQMMGGYVGFFILGYIIKQREITRKENICAEIIFISCFAIISVGTFMMTDLNGKFNDTFMHTLSFTNIILTCTFFIVSKNIFVKMERKIPQTIKKMIVTISGASFGIYLIHVLILNNVPTFVPAQALNILVAAIIVFMVSTIIVLALQKIPIIRYIVP